MVDGEYFNEAGVWTWVQISDIRCNAPALHLDLQYFGSKKHVEVF